MYLGFLFRPTKLDFLLISRFSCVACQTVHRQIKTNIFRAIFSYGENWNSGALENQLRSFQGRSLNTSFFQISLCSLSNSASRKKINVLMARFGYGKNRSSFRKSVTIFPKNFSIMYWGFIFQRKKFDLLVISRFCTVACQTVHTDIKVNVFRAWSVHGEVQS